MDCHALQVYEFLHNLHVSDERHFASLYQIVFGSVLRRHPNLQSQLGRENTPYLIGPRNPAITHIVCLFGEMNFWYDPGSIYGVHD